MRGRIVRKESNLLEKQGYSERGLQQLEDQAQQLSLGVSNEESTGWGSGVTQEAPDFFDSTYQGQSNDEDKIECVHCHEPHNSSDCPKRRESNQRYRNDRYDGPSLRDARTRAPDAKNFNAIRCSNCEGKGHNASVCPSGRIEKGGRDASSDWRDETASLVVCYLCQKTGHLGYQCSSRVGADSNAVPSEPYKTTIITTEEDIGTRTHSHINFDKYDQTLATILHADGLPAKEYEARKLNTFHDANISPEIIQILDKMEFRKPTPVQKYAIPILLDGKDLLASAQTGSGKTAAFLIPILNRLIKNSVECEPSSAIQKPRALILTPTRELTVQVTRDAQLFCLKTNIKVKECYGGTDLRNQMHNIRKGCHLIVGTLGRTKDLLKRNTFSLENLEYLVIDEADKMLEMGFAADIEEIMGYISKSSKAPQKLLFSATFPENVQKIARKYLNKNFIRLDVGAAGTVNTDIHQRIESITGVFKKKQRLYELVQQELAESKHAKVLVFVETKRTADAVAAFFCEMKIKATSMHGDRFQEQREEALRDFQRGRCPVLVATSVAARGLDVSGISHVINFDLPKEIEEYVHRVGRTGRLGNKGRATSFYDPTKNDHLKEELREALAHSGISIPDFLGSDSMSSMVDADSGLDTWAAT